LDSAPRPGQPGNGRRPAGQQAGAPVNPLGLFGAGQGIAQAPPQPAQQPGWLGRFLNVAVQPPLILGQGGNGFVPGVNPGQNNGIAWGQFPQQPHPYGQFMYPYQPPPQQLQPPPPFPGFYGPGGAWQQWGLGPQAHGEQQQEQQQRQQQQQSQPPQVPTHAPDPPTVTSEPQVSPSTAPDPPPANSSSTSPLEAQRASSPREAAASAALRRLNSGPLSSGSISTSGATNFSSPNPGTRQGDPSRLTESASSAIPPAQNSNSASTVPTNGAPLVPSLIPLTDFGAMSRGPFFNSFLPHQQMPVAAGTPTYIAPTGQNGIHHQHPQNIVPRSSHVQSRPVPPNPLQSPSTQAQTSTSSFMFTSPIPHGSSNASNHSQRQQESSLWSQLPQILTDDQLLRMDVLTREAIDERLKVLGRVDQVLNMCIDELTRVRSVLPPAGSGIGTNTSASASRDANGVTPPTGEVSAKTPGTSEAPAADESSEKARGKEKAGRPVYVYSSSDSD
jgi:E3 ubiquitin-protein ligase synoviolin